MDFFDDLSKKITHVGQTAVQKTKDMTDVAKINGLIYEEEKKAENLYLQIGKLYVKKHRNDGESDFANLVSSVCGSEDKIKEYKKQILDIKGIACCEKCGSEIAGNAAFCNICGTPVPKPEQGAKPANEVKCSGCGSKVEDGMRFCTVCGKPVEKAPEAPAPVAEPAEKKCPKCGAVMAKEMRFCTSCGTSLEAPAEAPAPEAPAPEKAEPAPEAPAPVAEPAEKKCPNCGTIPGEGMAFCTECGTKLN